MRRALVALALVGAVLAACEGPAAPGESSAGGASPAAAFAHAQTEDISGLYRPVGEVGMDDLALHQLSVGQTRDFAAWEAAPGGGHPPVSLEFMALGGRVIAVRPATYDVANDRVAVTGQIDHLGPISLDVRLDPQALATARRNLGEEAPVMRGVLTIAGRPHRVSLNWYGGD